MGFRNALTPYPRDRILEALVWGPIIRVLAACMSNFAHGAYIIGVKSQTPAGRFKPSPERYSVLSWKKTWTLWGYDTAAAPGATTLWCMIHDCHPPFWLHQISTNFPSRMKYIRSVRSPDLLAMAVRSAPSGIDLWSTFAIWGKSFSGDLISVLEGRAVEPTILILPTLFEGTFQFVIIGHQLPVHTLII